VLQPPSILAFNHNFTFSVTYNKILFSLLFMCNEESGRLIVLTVSQNTKYAVGDFMEYVIRKVLLSCNLLMMHAAYRLLRLLCYCGRISRRWSIFLV